MLSHFPPLPTFVKQLSILRLVIPSLPINFGSIVNAFENHNLTLYESEKTS